MPYLFIGENDKKKLLEINQWGNIQWESMRNVFYKCSNLEMLAQDVPDLSKVSSMDGMFTDAINGGKE